MDLAATLREEMDEGAFARLGDAGDVEARLRSGYQEGLSAWPGTGIDAHTFVRHLARCLRGAPDPTAALGAMRMSDVFLACGCVNADPAALRHFETRILPEIELALRAAARSDLLDDVRQILRETLLLGKGGEPPKIADYSGRGLLRSWVRVVAVRTAFRLQRRQSPELPVSRAGIDLVARANPELEYLISRYRAPFKEALHRALDALPPPDRVLLEMHFVEGLSLSQVGALYQVNKSTVSRWMARIRATLLADARRLLAEHLDLPESEIDSLIGMMQSHLALTLSTILTPGSSDDTA